MNTLEWLSKLISFDTISRNSNLGLIEYVKNFLAEQGIESHLVNAANEPKANLIATIPGTNGNTHGGLVFSGHTDVVPVDGQQWDTNPFEMVQKDDKIYGRGSCDMKGFLAVVLSLVPDIKNMQLTFPVHLAFSYDEEIGCRGAPYLIADLVKMGMQPAACIVGEPTSMRPVTAHKGIQVFQVKVKGLAAHSSLTPKGCNAIEYAAKLICFIRELAGKLQQGPIDTHFDVPFTTITSNMIQGGIAHNVIPAQCEFNFEFRHLPGVIPQEIIDPIQYYVTNDLLPAMRQEYANADITIENIAAAPSFEAGESTIQQLSRKVCNEHDIVKVAYATEAGLFEQANIPTIVCGPGSIDQAHRANEFVTLVQLEQCETFLRQLIIEFNILQNKDVS